MGCEPSHAQVSAPSLALRFLVLGAILFAGMVNAQPRLQAEAGEAAMPPAPMDEWLRRLVGKYRFEGSVEVVYEHEGEDYEEHRCAPLPPPPSEPGEPPPPPAVPYCSAISGNGDCVGIGSGPGVQCVLNVTWQDIHEVLYQESETDPDTPMGNKPTGIFSLPGGVSNLNPSMVLFGIDPGKPALSYLLVDNKGLPEGGLGSIVRNRATFRTPCVNAPSLFLAMKPPPIPPDPTRPEGPPRTCERITRIDARPDAAVMHWSMDIEINGELWTRLELSLRRMQQEEKGALPAKTPASR